MILARVPKFAVIPAAVLVAFVLVLVVSPAVREFAQSFLFVFRERPFTVVRIDGGVFQSGMGALGLTVPDAIDISYEIAPALEDAGLDGAKFRWNPPREPAGIAADPVEAIFGPVVGTLEFGLEPLPISIAGLSGAGSMTFQFDFPPTSVLLYANDPSALDALRDRRMPEGGARFIVYGETVRPRIVAGGDQDLARLADSLAGAHILPVQFRSQLRVVADWLGYLLPDPSIGAPPEPPPPLLVQGLDIGDIVIWERDGAIGILIGNVGVDLLLELAKRVG